MKYNDIYELTFEKPIIVISQNEERTYKAFNADYTPAKNGGYLLRVRHVDWRWYPVGLFREELKIRAVLQELFDNVRLGREKYHIGPDENPYSPNWIPYPNF